MHINDLLKPESIALGVSAPASKEAAIRLLADYMEKGGNLSDKEQYVKDVLTREESGTTGLGDGIATPHAKSDGVKAAGLAAMTIPDGMDFAAMDGNPSRLFFMIAAPNGANDEHLAILSKLATMIMDPDFKESLIAAKTVEEFRQLVDDKENDRFVAPSTGTASEETKPTADHIQILAVTACPTGIAHTFMAAESIEQHAKKRGLTVKVETNGSAGIKNALTPEEIAAADGIIVAADKNVAMSRFDGRRVVITKVADGINKADELIDRALSGSAPVYRASGADEAESAGGGTDESLARQIYKHLMNGVSHMLPFVVGGGILIALAFLFDDYSIDPSKFGSNTPLAKFFMQVGGASFGFMLPVLAGFIGMSIADRPGLAVGFVGGSLAGATGTGFLGALLAGFVGGYAVNFLKKVFAGLPASLDGIKPILLYPFFGILIMGLISLYIIAPPVSAINNWMVSTLGGMDPSARILMGLIVGGMMAVDMGGPINKAAYVTGTGLLASGEYHVMAAVMAGGMVPPLAIALATTLFKNRFTESQRKAGITNYVMGLSFITEGAIPFAAADPVRVIPSMVVGSALAGALTMFFDCTLRAPHGGIFVVPTIGNPLMYLVSILIGAIVGAIILSLLKKPIKE